MDNALRVQFTPVGGDAQVLKLMVSSRGRSGSFLPTPTDRHFDLELRVGPRISRHAMGRRRCNSAFDCARAPRVRPLESTGGNKPLRPTPHAPFVDSLSAYLVATSGWNPTSVSTSSPWCKGPAQYKIWNVLMDGTVIPVWKEKSMLLTGCGYSEPAED